MRSPFLVVAGRLVAAAALMLGASPAMSQVCDDVSDECRTTPLLDCTDAIGESVTVQIGGLGAVDSNADGGTCEGVPATALLTFKKTAADKLELTANNSSCAKSTLVAAFWNMTTTVTALSNLGVTAVAPATVDTVWTLGYSQTNASNDMLGFRADGFGNFDANVHNGDLTPSGGDPSEILAGETQVYTMDVTPGYDLCDILSALSTPPPGDRNRNAVGKFQSCGTTGGSAFIGPCTPGDELFVVIGRVELTPGDGRMTVDWDTSIEADNAGFNVLRREAREGGWSYVNAVFIAGAGDSVSGAAYRFEDRTARNGVEYQYRIEDVDFGGKKGLSPIHNGVANPQDPEVKLQTPGYGAAVAMDRDLRLAFEGIRTDRGTGVLQVSASPAFEAGSTLEMPVRIQVGVNEVRPNGRMLTQMQDASAVNGAVYWRITDRNGKAVSDTFRMEVE